MSKPEELGKSKGEERRRAVLFAMSEVGDFGNRNTPAPLWAFFDLALALAVRQDEMVRTGKRRPDVDSPEKRTLSKLEEVIPPELVSLGEDNYEVNMCEIVFAILSYDDLDVAANAVITFPTVNRFSLVNKSARSGHQLDAPKEQMLNSYLEVHESYVEQGGEINCEAVRIIYEALETDPYDA